MSLLSINAVDSRNTLNTQGAPASALAPAPTEPPAAKFKTSWLGVASGVGVGAVVGGIIGLGLLAFSGSGSAGMTGAGLATVLLGAAIIGAPIGGFVEYSNQKSSFAAKQKADHDAVVGTPIAEVRASVIAPYDHNGNGAIDLDNPSALDSMDERFQIDHRTQSKSHSSYNIFTGKWETTYQDIPQTRKSSATAIWDKANVNKDRVVSADEIDALLASFDANHDGSLQTDEITSFTQANSPVVEDWNPPL